MPPDHTLSSDVSANVLTPRRDEYFPDWSKPAPEHLCASESVSQAPQSEVLVVYANIVTPSNPSPSQTPDRATRGGRRLLRYALQNGARRLLTDPDKKFYDQERTCRCLRATLPQVGKVPVVYSEQYQRARYSDLEVCGSVWSCPVCAARITEERRQELQQAVDIWQSQGRPVYMLTLTFSHGYGDDLDDLLVALLGDSDNGVQGAYRRFINGKQWRRIKDLMQIEGTVKALEVTHGRNGWHPHLHVLLFCKREPFDNDYIEIEARIRRKWDLALSHEGLHCDRHGVDLRLGDHDVGDYVDKFGNDLDSERLSFEVVGGHYKLGRSGGETWQREHEMLPPDERKAKLGNRTSTQLLFDYSILGDKQAGFLWLTYARAFKGRNQLVWSRGFKARFGLDDVDDQELAEDITDDDRLLAALVFEEWQMLLALEKRGELLDVASLADVDLIRRYLVSIGVWRDIDRDKACPQCGKVETRSGGLCITCYRENERVSVR